MCVCVCAKGAKSNYCVFVIGTEIRKQKECVCVWKGRWWNSFKQKVVWNKVITGTFNVSLCLSCINIHQHSSCFLHQTDQISTAAFLILSHFITHLLLCSHHLSFHPSLASVSSPTSLLRTETGLIEINELGEQIRVDYIGCVGILIACLLSECCRTS